MPEIKMLLVTEVSKSSKKANTTFYSMKGGKYFRSKINKNTSSTLKQKMQRTKFGEEGRICKGMKPTLAVSMEERDGMSPSNWFMQLNDALVTVSEELEVTVNYPEMQLCNRDDRDMPESITVTADAEMHTLTFVHEAEEYGAYAEPTDKLYAALYNSKSRRSKLYELNTRANTEPAVVNVPQRWAMEDVKVYVFVLSEDGKHGSPSMYLEVE